MEATLVLKPGRERSILQRHPWIFSGAIEKITGKAGSGETVSVVSSRGEFLGKAAYSPQSNIRARMWTWGTEEIDEGWFTRRVERSLQMRSDLLTKEDTAVRLVHAESDGIPGLIVDRYADTLVFQFLSAGAEFWREDLIRSLVRLTGCKDAFERSDVEVRNLEGLELRKGVLAGKPPQIIEIQESNLRFKVDIENGHKTGFYLDQRLNRRHFMDSAKGRVVLNCFCYTGAFSVFGLAGEAARIVSVDSSSEALKLGAENVSLNHFDSSKTEWMEGDVFRVLRTMRDQNRKFDAIILDPPKFAPTSAQAEKAARGYKDINLLCFKLLNPGGLLYTFSCSGGISTDFFQKIVAGAALDAEVDTRIIDRLFQSPDHAVTLNFPEGLYLKGLVIQVV